MALPTPTARTVPTGYKLPEGFKTTIAFSLRPAVNFWEMETAPAGIKAEMINTTTQHNTVWETKWPSALKEAKDVPGVAAFDPDFMDDIIFLVGAQSGSFTVWFPTGARTAYWGCLSDVTFQPLKPKQFPMLNFVASITNWDPVNKVEAGPNHIQVAGT